MTPPQGMSAKQEAELLVDSLAAEGHLVVTREQFGNVVRSIEIGFTNREAAARADERVISEKDLAALMCCQKCRAEIEAMHSRDLRAHSYAGEVVKRVEASQERVRVKGWNEGVKGFCQHVLYSYERYGSDDLLVRATTIANIMMQPEAQPVEPSEGEGTHG